MNTSAAIVKRFLKQNKPNEYHLITAEVYDAMDKVSSKVYDDAATADALRAIKGHLDKMKLYKEKGYNEGFITCMDRSIEIIDNTIEKLTEGTINE